MKYNLLERKTLEIKFKQESFVEDDEYYTFSGYGAVFDNVDLGNDRIKKGAFATSLTELTPKLCYQHDMKQLLGKFIEVKEDDHGLFVKAIMPKSNSQCKDVAALIKCGALDSMSIGYGIIKYAYDEDTNILDLIELKLFEISLVSLPMNPKARLTAFKSQNPNCIEDIKSMRDAELILKEVGFSVKEAKVFISKIKEINPRDEGKSEHCDDAKSSDYSVIIEEINKSTNLIKSTYNQLCHK